jgi:hypothetical protein
MRRTSLYCGLLLTGLLASASLWEPLRQGHMRSPGPMAYLAHNFGPAWPGDRPRTGEAFRLAVRMPAIAPPTAGPLDTDSPPADLQSLAPRSKAAQVASKAGLLEPRRMARLNSRKAAQVGAQQVASAWRAPKATKDSKPCAPTQPRKRAEPQPGSDWWFFIGSAVPSPVW